MGCECKVKIQFHISDTEVQRQTRVNANKWKNSHLETMGIKGNRKKASTGFQGPSLHVKCTQEQEAERRHMHRCPLLDGLRNCAWKHSWYSEKGVSGTIEGAAYDPTLPSPKGSPAVTEAVRPRRCTIVPLLHHRHRSAPPWVSSRADMALNETHDSLSPQQGLGSSSSQAHNYFGGSDYLPLLWLLKLCPDNLRLTATYTLKNHTSPEMFTGRKVLLRS